MARRPTATGTPVPGAPAPARRRAGGEALTRERVVAEAVRLADADGLGGLTMRRLGEALGVEAMSIYHHVDGKEALLDAMVDVVFAEVSVPEGDDWRSALQLRAESMRAALARHPWALAVRSGLRTPGPATLTQHDTVLGCLRRGGFSVPLAGHAFALLDAYVYGFAQQEAALPFESGQDTAEMTGAFLAAMPEGVFPYLREYAVDRVMQPGWDFANKFGWGLELVLDGLAERLSREAATASSRGGRRRA